MIPFLAGITLAHQAAPDPLLLEIGHRGSIKVETNDYFHLPSGKPVSAQVIARASRNTKFVYLGESHDNAHHHRNQAEIIEALVADDRDVVVGLEMFTRPAQGSLGGWTLGRWSEDEFIVKSDWKTQWGFDFGLYRPVFEAVKKHGLPMVALNVPREWVRTVGRSGYGALTTAQRSELPAQMNLANEEHRAVFTALMGGHPMTGAQGENIYAAQVLWDEAMADSAIKYLETRQSDRIVIVVIAGSGHVMYHQGINWRVAERTGDYGVTVVMAESNGPRQVAKGLADFVFLSESGPAK